MAMNRPLSQMRKVETKEAVFRARKRILRYLVLSFLKQEGLFNTADTMVAEASITNDFEVCDNIDLDIILQDYCSYYMMRFNKQPQFCRKTMPSENASAVARPKTRLRREPQPNPVIESIATQLALTLTSVPVLQEEIKSVKESSITSLEQKPLAGFLSTLTQEKKQMAEALYQEVIRPSTVHWDEVKGLDEAKSLLFESVVYPVKYPSVFSGALEPWRGVLLHGPPGTGKTMLARALASQAEATFFNVSCGTVVNKWRGDSEKIIQVLFSLASYYAPSIIFMDEVETLTGERYCGGEHEASRRLKSQLLTEIDGITKTEGLVFLLANSNMPWEIDSAMLRRLEKRIYIPLPDHKTRLKLIEAFLSSDAVDLNTNEVDFGELAKRTDGYSGSDIRLACKEALMTTVRKVLPQMEKGDRKCGKAKLGLSEILSAIDKTKPVSKNLAARHIQWQNEMGCS